MLCFKTFNTTFNIEEKRILKKNENVVFFNTSSIFKILIFTLSFFVFGVNSLFGQLTSTTYDFAANSTGWTGNFSRNTSTNASMCGSAAMRKNLWSSTTTGYLVSPQLPGTNNLGEVTLTYKYKAANYSSPYSASNPWGSFNVQVGNSASGPWTTISTVSQETQTGSCITKTITFTPPAGNLFIKWDCSWSTGDFWLSFDDITISQAAPVACSGTPNAGTATVSAEAGCSGSSITLSATGLSSGSGISTQWESGPTSTGPWTNISGATNNSANITSVNGTTFYRITTTCTSSGLTNSSNSVSFTGSTCGSVNIPSSGSTTVNCGTSTYIYDNGGSSGDYASSSNGYTVLDNSGTGVITLSGSYSGIESCCDYFKIYAGSGTSGTLLYTYSGTGTITTFSSSPGQQITIQFYSDGSLNGAGFVLTAIYSGTCASCMAPTALTSTVATTTAATISWTAASPAPANGYDYYISSTSTAPTAGTTPTGTTAAGVTTEELTSLTTNTIYYFWVRSNCGGGEVSSWVSGGSFNTLEGNTCGLVQDLASLTSPYSGTTVGFSNSFTNSCLTGTGGDRIFKIDVPDGFQLFIGQSVNGYDSKHRIAYGGTCPGTTEINTGYVANFPTQLTNGTSLGCLDDDDLTHYYFNNTTGSTQTVYWIQDGYSTNEGTFTLEWELSAAPTCIIPSALTSTVSTSTSASISWTAASPDPANGYDYYISSTSTAPTAGTTPTGTTAVGVTSEELTSLTANTTYYFWVRSNCGGGEVSSWVSGGSFYTGYCLPSGATNYYLNNVVTTGGLTNISNASGAGTGGYTNYSSTISCSNYVGATTSITLTPSSGTNYFYCWIDWNNDLDFNDANETIFATTTYTSNYTGSITIPNGTAIGNYRMRVANSWSGIITSCGPSSNGEYEDYTFSVILEPQPITITPASATTFCVGNSVDLTASSTAAYTYTWSPSTGLSSTNGTTVTANPTSTTTYTVTGDNGAGMVTSQNITITITPSPSDVTISNSSETVCKNSVQTLVANGGNISGVSTTISSGNVNLAIPDYNMSTGVSQVLSVNTIPENATITNIDVTFNITHTWDSDVIINLEAPNGKIVNLVAKEGSLEDNFTNTIITSNTSVSSIVGNSAPFTGTFQAELASNTNASSPTPAINTQLFSDLFSIPNGDWKLRVYDDISGDTGTLINCAITITYDSSQITWSPISDLYTDAACTVAYTGEHATTLYAKPSETRTYTASSIVGSCEKTDAITFTVASAVHDGTAWSSAPAANKELIFNGDFSSTENLEGCSCTVNSGNVVINSNHTLKISNEIEVNGGSITFENNSSLIQINDVTNLGNITYKRTSPQSVSNTDYVYWSSPVGGQTIPNGYNYMWNNAGGTSGNWTSAVGQSMTAGKGIIMRGTSSKTFTGVPYNGEIDVTVYRRNLAGYNDNWNLVGNPYPSAISADEFLTDLDNSNIEGSIGIWTHNSPISSTNGNPFYGNYSYNYNPSDYIIYNLSGSQNGPDTYNGYIPAGQAFFVKYNNDDNASPIAASSTIKFKNTMRTDVDGNSYNNSQFYRNNTSTQSLEKNRIWIDIVGTTSAYSRTMVGYIETATDNKDRLFDSSTSVTNTNTSIYSLINTDKMSIQAKGLPFNDTDSIALGYNAGQAGNFTIAIYAVDGLFVNQEVYLFDSELNIIHDIKTAPYTFTTLPGENNSRFSLVFNNETLSNPDYSIENSVLIINSNKLKVVSNLEEMESITVFDLLGRTIYNNSDINSKEFLLPIIQEQVPLIVKIKLSSGTIVQRKTFY